MSFVIVFACPKHDSYQAKLPPRVDCKHCAALYRMRQEMAETIQEPRAQRGVYDACIKSVAR